MQIIQAGPKHVDVLAPLFDLYRQFYKQPPDLDSARDYLRNRLERGEALVYLARDDQQALGFTLLYPTFSSISLKRLWILNDLYVVESGRRAGVARMLMERARQLALDTGAEGLILETALTNLPAQKLYEGLGWKRDEEFYRYFLKVASSE